VSVTSTYAHWVIVLDVIFRPSRDRQIRPLHEYTSSEADNNQNSWRRNREAMTGIIRSTDENAAEGGGQSAGLAGCNGDDIRRMRDLILALAVHGEVAQKVIKYLFRELGKPERICAQDISDNGGPKGDGNVCPLMCRLRDQVPAFFDYDPKGRKSRYRVAFPDDDRGNYALHIEINQPPNGFVPGLWNPHCSGGNVCVVYPQRKLIDDSFSSCRPNESFSNGRSVRSAAEFENDDCPRWKAGASDSDVRCLLRLSDHFRTRQVGVTADAVRPLVDTLSGGNLIVLATPASMPRLLPNLEATGRMRTGEDAITIMSDSRRGGKAKTCRDRLENSITGNDAEIVKWGVLTRHYYPFQRTITVLAARDETAVEAMVQFILNEEAMLMLARELRCGETFPDHFQALFCMRMFKGQPYAREMTVEQAVVLGANRKASSPPQE
jgi:hypothetical protein